MEVNEAHHVRVLIDAEEYFRCLDEAIDLATHTIYIAGWDFDSRLTLAAPSDTKAPTLMARLHRMLEEKPRLEVYVLIWDHAFIYAAEREFRPFFDWGVKRHRRLHFCLDSRHPFGASHHQKTVVIDDCLAFNGGIDLTLNRRDTPEHLPDDPRRVLPSGELYAPFHDVQLAVDGPAARHLAHLFRLRWHHATGRSLDGAQELQFPWPSAWRQDFRCVSVIMSQGDRHQQHRKR